MAAAVWPELPYAAWSDTLETVHLWCQIVGKIRLTLTPWVNHSWHVPFYVTSRGIGTSPMPIGTESLEIDFDFIAHRLVVRTSRGDEDGFALIPQSVAEFYDRVFAILGRLGIAVAIDDMPSEMTGVPRYSQDCIHASYDAEAAHRFWRVLVQADRVFKLFRSFSARQARCISFGAASTSRQRGFRAGRPPSIPAVSPACRTP
jgi:hypothetical protein